VETPTTATDLDETAEAPDEDHAPPGAAVPLGSSEQLPPGPPPRPKAVPSRPRASDALPLR
jgi:hypothetical protein